MDAGIRLAIAQPDITTLFEQQPRRVFSHADIARLLEENRQFWRLTGSPTAREFIEFLAKVTPLRKVRLAFAYRPVIRYAWGDVSTFQLIQSINANGYFTHYTAVRFHELTDQIPKTIYFNQEQRFTGGDGTLTQETIDRAFKAKCRTSNNTTTYDDYTICLINGRNTTQLGVVNYQPESLRVTNVERTLIDIVVRPVYGGGVFQVAQAFARAKGEVSVNKLTAYLKTLRYTYPYHQSIGFYLERSGYKPEQLALLQQFEIQFDFYLTHQMKKTEYNERWRLFIPKGF